MVAGIVFIIIRVVTNVTVFVSLFIIVALFVIRFKAAFLLILGLGAEACFGLAHFIELRVILVVRVVLKDLILLVFQVLVLQFLDDLLLLSAALAVLEVVHVQLILKVVDVRVLLNVRSVEPL